MIEYGTVAKLYNKDNENKAKVVIQRHEMCGDCKACDMRKSDKKMVALATNKAHAKVGDHVAISMEMASLMKASSIAYGLPLLGFLIGVFAGYYAAPSFGLNQALTGFFAGIILTAVAYLIIKLLDKRGTFGHGKYEPTITEVLPPEKDPLINGPSVLPDAPNMPHVS